MGRPIGQFYLLKSEGIWQTNEAAEAAKYNAQPGDRKILDAKKDYVINGEDRDFCGVSTPKYYGSFTNTFSYKGIDLTAFFTFAGGHKINNSLNRYLNSFNVWGNMSENYYKYYWRQDRPNNKYPAPRVLVLMLTVFSVNSIPLLSILPILVSEVPKPDSNGRGTSHSRSVVRL